MAEGSQEGNISLSDVTGALGDIFGGGSSQSGAVKGTTTQRSKLKIDDAGVQKIIEDVLSGPEGLASIFAGEQTAGIFSSSVSAQAAGDLASKLAGEIAKLTAEKETVQEVDTTTGSRTKNKGLIESIGDTIGSLF